MSSSFRLLIAVAPLLAALGVLPGCALLQPPPPPPPPPPVLPVEPPTPVTPPPAPAEPVAASEPAAEPAVATPVRGGQPGGVRPDTSGAAVALLAYADRVRRMAPPELTLELTRLSELPEPQRQPYDDLQQALALMQTRLPSDQARAQMLVQRVLANTRDDVRHLHPLAGMLAARYAEQKRLEDQIERQSQQLRDNQRRIDLLNERLEAVRAIERSLTARPAAPALAAPNGGAPRPATP